MIKFEGQNRRQEKIDVCLKKYGFADLQAADDLCKSKGIDVREIVENAVWAYTLGTAIAIKKGITAAAQSA